MSSFAQHSSEDQEASRSEELKHREVLAVFRELIGDKEYEDIEERDQIAYQKFANLIKKESRLKT